MAPVSQALYQLRLPALDRLNTTVETCVLPPISLSLSFLVPVSAFPCLFQHLVGVPFYRLPKTLGWPYSDAPLNRALIPDPPLAALNLAPLLSLLRVLPFFTPPSVRNKVTNHLQGESGCHYTLDAIVYILEKGMRPGTKNPDGDIETTYDWPLNWEIPDFTSDLCKGLYTHTRFVAKQQNKPRIRSNRVIYKTYIYKILSRRKVYIYHTNIYIHNISRMAINMQCIHWKSRRSFFH